MPQTVNVPERLPISINPDELTALCHRYGIRELALFGSVLRDDFTSQSDVDVLYEMGPTSAIRSLFDVGVWWETSRSCWDVASMWPTSNGSIPYCGRKFFRHGE